MTPYLLLTQACGLSLREAANLRNVRLDTVKSWSAGRNNAPDQALEQLRNLYFLIAATAEKHRQAIAEIAAAHPIEIGYPADDHEAQSLGFPCVGAWRAMASILIAELDAPVKLVPRGSTPATAAAMDAHGQ